MNVTVTKLVVTDAGISLAMRLEYFPGGPIRFFQGLIPWGLFDDASAAAIMVAFNDLHDRALDAEPPEDELPSLL